LAEIFLCNKFAAHLKIQFMIVVPIKEGENIERALKKFKRKFEKTGIVKQLRARQAFKKPSERKRDVVKRAIYIQKLQQEEE
jgi:small subunit ribosomal protein S21